MTPPFLYLKRHEERRLLAGHCWVYSNEVDVARTPLTAFSPGQWVVIASSREQRLGVGYVNPRSLIAARLLTRDPHQAIDRDFVAARLREALSLRERLFERPYYRLVFGESDRLPGLVIDRYGEVCVAQMTTAGMEGLKDEVVAAIQAVLTPVGILLRNDSPMRVLEGLPSYVEAIGEVPDTVELEENGVRFRAPMKGGQKTGWFYDHRLNRARLRDYVKGKRVLDLFSYLGGWGVQAAVYGAKEVLCVDASAPALEYVGQNAALNGVAAQVQVREDDVFDALKGWVRDKEWFDLVIADPPAFIKKRKDVEEGTEAYRRLNALAMQVLAPAGGILVTSSCSLHLPPEGLLDAVRRAGIKRRRSVQLLEQGHQGPDHPIHPAIPETAYLKCLTCRVSGPDI